jgi:pilus assembly protein CpaB
MNLTRVIVFCVALSAAGAAVLVARGMLGGGTPSAEASLQPPPPAIEMVDILVAAKDIGSGQILEPSAVRWQTWPKEAASDAFVVKEAQPDLEKAVAGIVVRTPLVAGQPVTEAIIVRAGKAGFLAATLSPGMRAVAIPVTADSSAGGFILPNDRVDVILTRKGTGGASEKVFSSTLVRSVRVLAIDQAAEQPKDKQSSVGKTATIELTPGQSEAIETARMRGNLSLALRPLGDTDETEKTQIAAAEGSSSASVNIIRYGVASQGSAEEEGATE